MRKITAISKRRALALAFALLAARSGSAGSSSAPAEKRFYSRPDGIPDEYIVVLHPGAVDRLQDLPRAGRSVAEIAMRLGGLHRGKVLATYEHALKGFAVRMSAAEAEALSRDPDVLFVEQNATFPLQNVTLDCRLLAQAPVQRSAPPASSPQTITCADPDPNATSCIDNWGLDRIDQRVVDGVTPRDGKYFFSTTAATVHAYMFDTGLTADQLEFSGRIGVGYDGFGGSDTADCADIGHGTHVAGILAGATSGVAKGVLLHPVRVGCNSGVDLSALLKGIDWVVDSHPAGQPAVSNLSSNALGINSFRALAAALTKLVQDGVVFVESAGNQNASAGAYSLAAPNSLPS